MRAKSIKRATGAPATGAASDDAVNMDTGRCAVDAVRLAGAVHAVVRDVGEFRKRLDAAGSKLSQAEENARDAMAFLRAAIAQLERIAKSQRPHGRSLDDLFMAFDVRDGAPVPILNVSGEADEAVLSAEQVAAKFGGAVADWAGEWRRLYGRYVQRFEEENSRDVANA